MNAFKPFTEVNKFKHGKWKVVVQRGDLEDGLYVGYEIAIVWSKDKHGAGSYGWAGESKIILACDSHSVDPLPKSIYDNLITFANIQCELINKAYRGELV